MAQTRKREREARQAARRAEVEAAAKKRERADRRRALVPTIPRRRRRYGALPTRTRLQLLAAFAAVQLPVWVFVPATGARLVLAVLTAACLLVHVKTRRSPAR